MGTEGIKIIIRVGMAETQYSRQSMALFFLQSRYGDLYKQWLGMLRAC
jgi:hypothetical protein